MKKLCIYLDNCCFNRPYDDQSFASIFLETQAKLLIQELIKDNKLNLIWSFILDYENEHNPDISVRKEIFLWRELASAIIYNNKQLSNKAKTYSQINLKNKDALHLASAVEIKCDFFITVDKGILKKKLQINEITICSPIEFIEYLEEI